MTLKRNLLLALALIPLLAACEVGGVQLTKEVVFCEFENEKYQPGEAITQPDGCNTCICSAAGEIEACTELVCEEPITGLANPAAVKCSADGFHYEIRENSDGGQFGVCLNEAAGSECAAWAYFRGECTFGENSTAVEEIPALAEVDDAAEAVATETDSSTTD